MKTVLKYLTLVVIVPLLSGCGLKLQRDELYKGGSIDPHENMTCWEFLNAHQDKFSMLISGIEICGMEDLYKQTDQKYTYLALTDKAISGDVNKATTPEMIQALKDILLFHIIKGDYHGYGTLSYSPTFVETLYKGDAKMSIMLSGVNSNEDYIDRIMLMSGCGSSSVRYSVGSNHICTNGPVHVMDDKCVYKP